MKHIRHIQITAAAASMLLLILDSRTALAGAREGINLCITTVIPSLFPFFLISGILTGSLQGVSPRPLRPLGRLTGIPCGSEPLLLVGLLGGYPLGATCIMESVKGGRISRHTALRMMTFCNQPGPAFIFGIAAGMFSEMWIGLALWLIQIVSAIVVSMIIPGNPDEKSRPQLRPAPPVTAVLSSSLRTMAMVCGWVTAFKVILAFLNRWVLWILPPELSVMVSGLLELANGCCGLSAVTSQGFRFLLCAVMLSFGGFCVYLQTVSVAGTTLARWYLPGKLLQTMISLMLGLLLQPLIPDCIAIPPFIPLLAAISIVSCLLIGKKLKNSSSFPEPVGV